MINNYIIPAIGFGVSSLSSFFSYITDSVVRIVPAIEAAFSNAIRVTFLGSIIPNSLKSTISRFFERRKSMADN